MNFLNKTITAGVILVGSFIFLAVTVIAAINNWGAFKYDDNTYEEYYN